MLTVLAAEALGDPHALDRGSPVAAGVLRLLGHDLPGTAESWLSIAAGPEPVWLTWRSLTGTFGSQAPDIYVCENPSVLIAAADQLGARCSPLKLALDPVFD